MTTKELVRDLRIASPNMKAITISRTLNVSREWVRQILKELGLPTNFIVYREYACVDCGKKLEHKATRCFLCYLAHRSQEHRTKFTCIQCGITFPVRNNRVRASEKKGITISFCGNKCQGTWLGNNYGRGKKKE